MSGALPVREVMRLTSLSRATLWRLSRKGAFPRPLHLSPGRIAWLESEVEAWLAARGGAR